MYYVEPVQLQKSQEVVTHDEQLRSPTNESGPNTPHSGLFNSGLHDARSRFRRCAAGAHDLGADYENGADVSQPGCERDCRRTEGRGLPVRY